jgi:hypothetical protein
MKRYLIGWHMRRYLPGLYIAALNLRTRMLRRDAAKLIRRGCLAQAGLALQTAEAVSAAAARAKRSSRR